MQHVARSFRIAFVPFVLGAVLASAGGCKSNSDTSQPQAPAPPPAHSAPAPPALDQLAVAALFVADTTSERDRPVDLSERVGAQIKPVFADEKWLLRWAPDAPGLAGGYEIRAAVYYALQSDGEVNPRLDEGTAYASVVLYAERAVDKGLKEKFEARGQAEIPFTRGDGGEAVVAKQLLELVEGAARTARGKLEARLRLQYAGGSDLIRALESDDRDRQLAALASAASHVPAAEAGLVADAVAPLLTSDDKELVIAAISALGAIDTEESVRPLANLATSNDAAILLPVVAALGRMKNERARRYLQGIAETHAYQPIREAAERALSGAP